MGRSFGGARLALAGAALGLAVGLCDGAPVAAAGLEGLENYYLVGPAEPGERFVRGEAVTICAPRDVPLPKSATHHRVPASEAARGLSIDFCEAALVERADVDQVLADAMAMGAVVQARRVGELTARSAAASPAPAPPAPEAPSPSPPSVAITRTTAGAAPTLRDILAVDTSVPSAADSPRSLPPVVPASVIMNQEQAQIVYADGARYQGGVADDQPEGMGELRYADGARYVGAFKDGLRHGAGRLTLADGLVYEGGFTEDAVDGRGRLAWADGAVYEGAFVMGRRTGVGVYVWPSGSRYEGPFDDGVIVGPGIFVAANGDRYEGEFAAGRRTGRGVLTFADGGRYEGGVRDGRPHGDGTYTWPDGRTRAGRWANGAPVQ